MTGDKAEDATDRESVQLRFSISQVWVEEELLPAYPSTTTVSQAARQAISDGVDASDDDDAGVEARIGSEVIAALRESGGVVENNQTIEIRAGEREG